MSNERTRNFRAWVKRLCGTRFNAMKISLYDPLPKALKSSIRNWGTKLWWPLWQKRLAMDVTSEPDLALSSVKRLHIVVGQKCNQQCLMCTSRDDDKGIHPDIYRHHLQPLYEHIEEVVIQGGEPTIITEAAECMDTILATNSAVRFSIMTNGKAFDENWRTRFLEHGHRVNFSLNAATEETYNRVTCGGDWKRVMANLEALITARNESHSKLLVTCSFVVLRENEHEIEAFRKLCRELGCDGVRFFQDSRAEMVKGRHSGSGSGSSNSKSSMISEASNCELPFEALFVHTDGCVSFCCHMRDYLGNVLEEPIEKLWNNIVAKSIRLSFKKDGRAICRAYCSLSEESWL